MNRLIKIFSFSLLIAISVTATAQTLRVTGIYSDLTYNEEGGDLLGMELIIIPSADGPKPAYSVFVQIAEGGASFSAVVPIKVSGSTIEFTLPTGGVYDREHFVGTLSDSALTILWSNGKQEILKRGKSYWQ